MRRPSGSRRQHVRSVRSESDAPGHSIYIVLHNPSVPLGARAWKGHATMGILINAPTRRQEAQAGLATVAGRGCRHAGRVAHPRGRAHDRPAPRAALHVAATLRLPVAAAGRIRRPRLSARPGGTAQAHQAAACPRAGAPAPWCRWPSPRCSRCSASRSRIPRRCPTRSRSAVRLLSQHRIGELQNHLSKLLVGQGLRKFLETHADPAQRGGARARRARRDAELPGVALCRPVRSACCAT